MKITNNTGLPEIFVRAVKGGQRTRAPADISPSGMTKSIRETKLTQRHWDEIERDAATMVWAMFGTALHSVVTDYAEGDMVEKELEAIIDIDGEPSTFRGVLDLYTEGCLFDFKVTSSWTIVFGSQIESWELQLNSYRYLLDIVEGISTKAMYVIALLRDWSATKAERDKDYPQSDIQVIPIHPRPIHEYLEDKIRNLRIADELEDEDLPYCTPEERWETATKYAVMKEGRKSAVKVCDNEMEASVLVEKYGSNHYVEERPGKPNKCDKYCAGRAFCNQRIEEVE